MRSRALLIACLVVGSSSLIALPANAATGWQISISTAPGYIQDLHFSARGSNERGYTGGGVIAPSLLWQDCILPDWSDWPSDANLLGWKTRVIAAGVVDAGSVVAPGVYAENWRSPLVGHPPNQGPDDCSDIPVEVGTAEVVAGRTFYAVIASKEQYNRFTGTPAPEAWLDLIFWDYDPAGGSAVKMVHLLPIGFVPGPSGNAWADIDLDALRAAGIVAQITPATAVSTREGPLKVMVKSF